MSVNSQTRALNRSTNSEVSGNPQSLLNQLQLRQRWDALGARERRLVLGASVLVAVALLWWIALGPALATLRLAREQHVKLDAQMQQMQSLKAQANTLAALPKVSMEDARRSLETSLKQTLEGSAQMTVVGNRATVTLKGASPDALAQWLQQARINARATPTEVRLIKSAGPSAPAADAANQVRWEGSVVLTLPER
jgi:general secretion pathway protein M